MRPSDRAWAHVSGFPSDRRKARLLMVVQAWVDDSGSDPQDYIFVLGGFIAPASQWADFYDAWKTALYEKPMIEYFKFNEAMALKNQFDKEKGWTDKLAAQKIDKLVDVILRHVKVRAHATIKHAEFVKYLGDVPAPKRSRAISSPYTMLAMQLILAVAAWAPIRNIFEPVDFIFDEQGDDSDELTRWYPIFKSAS